MILFRNGFGLFDQEELAVDFGVKIDPQSASAFSSGMPIMTQANFDEGISTVESESVINDFFEKNKINLLAKSFKYSDIDSVPDFIKANLGSNNDLWVEYHGHEIYADDAKNGNYIHDGLIESVDLDSGEVILIDPSPRHKQRNEVSVDMIARAISTKFGKETGFIVVSTK